MSTVAERLDKIAASTELALAFDGCHKIYLIENDEDRLTAIDCGYDPVKDTFPAFEIHRLWKKGLECGLVFVHPMGLTRDHPLNIDQFEEEEGEDD